MNLQFQIHDTNINSGINLNDHQNQFFKVIDDPLYGFFKYDDIHLHASQCKSVHEQFKNKKKFIHVGIGGSSLGPEMLIKALKKNQFDFRFINNIDSDEIFDQLNGLSIKDSLFYIVSKSGGTAETMASLMIICDILKKHQILEKDFHRYFVFATDPNKSELLEFSRLYNIQCLPIPSNIGGRYSALTPVGLFPCLFAGIDIDQLINGFQFIQQSITQNLDSSKTFFQTALVIHDLALKNIHQTVLMPYSSKLKEFSSWFVQLWAESLGKNNIGLTPIASYGATDQHSQMQLFMEGPKDKLIFIIGIKNRSYNFSLNLENSLNLKSLSKLNGKSLNQLMDAELKGTLRALNEAKRNLIYIELDTLNEFTLAGLILWFEALTVRVAQLLKVDPFNQPGVEAGKIFAYQFLDNKN